MKERPILFSGPMVRPILEGRKTQTRRVVGQEGAIACSFASLHKANPTAPNWRYAVGDKLWVRESWACVGVGKYAHRATDEHLYPDIKTICRGWRPSIFMRRDISRLTLGITEVRVQRVQEISEEDAEHEGVSPKHDSMPEFIPAFARLWDSINAKRGFGWDKNPWVWVITFKTI